MSTPINAHPHSEPSRPQPMPVRILYQGKALVIDIMSTGDTTRAHHAALRAFTRAQIHPNQTIQAELFS